MDSTSPPQPPPFWGLPTTRNPYWWHDATTPEPSSGSRPDHTHPLDLHAAIYWSVFVGVILLTLGSLILFYKCVACHYSDIRHRLTYYDYETLDPTHMSLALNVLLYRHRPLLLELVKLIWLASIAVCLVVKFNKTATIFMLVTWCILDVFMLINGIFYAVIEGGVLRRRSHHATSLAKYISAFYSLLFGMPIGSVTKLLVIFWLIDRVKFSMPFTLASCCVAATGVAMLLAALVMAIRACIRSSPTSSMYRKNVLSLVICGLVGLLWAYLLGCLAQCSLFSTEPLPSYMQALGCTFWSQYWGSALLSLTLPMLIASCALSAKMVFTGMLWRFFPEILLSWAVTLAAHASAFQRDIGMDDYAYYHYFVLQVVVCEGICIILLVAYNVYTIVLTVDMWRAISSRHMDRVVDLLHLTQTERNLYFGGTAENRPNRRLNTLKKSVLQKLYEKMEEHTSIRAFLRNTLRENIRKYGDVNQCAICFEDYTENPSKVVLGVSKVCGHYFHFDCVWRWLEQRPTCPLCRDSVTLEKGDLRAITYELVQKATMEDEGEAAVEGKEGDSGVEEQPNKLPEKDSCSSSTSKARDTEGRDTETRDTEACDTEAHDTEARDTEALGTETRDTEVRNSEVGLRHPSSCEADSEQSRAIREERTLAEVHVQVEVETRAVQPWPPMGVLPRAHARRGQRSSRHHPGYQRSTSHPESPAAPPQAGPRLRRTSSPLFAAFTACTICRQRYAGSSSDIIVGFLPECGHFFHYMCVQKQLEREQRCPQCVRKLLDSRDRRDTRSSSSSGARGAVAATHTVSTLSHELQHYNRTVTADHLRFAFLMDVMCMSRRSRSQ